MAINSGVSLSNFFDFKKFRKTFKKNVLKFLKRF